MEIGCRPRWQREKYSMSMAQGACGSMQMKVFIEDEWEEQQDAESRRTMCGWGLLQPLSYG